MKTKTESKQVQAVILDTEPEDKGLRDETKAEIEQIEKSWFIVSKNLYLIDKNQLYLEWRDPETGENYKNMEEYVQKELAQNYRNMRHKIAVGRTLVKCNITLEQIEGINEWTKFKAIRPLLEADDLPQERLNELLTLARTKSTRELEEYTEQKRVEYLGGRPVRHSVIKMNFKDEQRETFFRVTGKVMRERELPSIDLAVEYIMLEWELNNNPDEKFVERMKNLMSEGAKDASKD
jgi:hypothetical protein